MSTPSHEEAWDPVLAPRDPSTLPPGFYFPPGTGPNAAPPAPARGPAWFVAAVGVLVLVAVAVVVVAVVLLVL